MGYCSRSQARDLVEAGHVRVNSRKIANPEFPTRVSDVIEVDGRAVRGVKKVYLMMNKPRGLVTSARDEKGRATVYSLLPSNISCVAPVGRLDKASEGLLLFTNHSEW